jgi:hypothetical protein
LVLGSAAEDGKQAGWWNWDEFWCGFGLLYHCSDWPKVGLPAEEPPNPDKKSLMDQFLCGLGFSSRC